MSSSSEKQKSIRKRLGKRKRSSNFCSTPVVGNARRLSSISISAVDTNSSSSTKRKTPRVNPGRKRIKKKRLQKSSLKQREGKQKRKTSKKGVEGKRRRNKLIEQRKSNDDWETCDESLRQSTEFEKNVLFKDIRSPEHIRDAPRFIPDYLDSPILRPHRWDVDSPQITFEENEERLLVKDLPFSHEQFYDNDDEGDVLSFRRDNTVKTYPGLRSEKLQRDNASIEKCKAWLVNVSIPTTSSNLLWESFVRNNYDKVAKYLAPFGNDGQRQHCREKNIGTDEYESFEKEDNYGKQLLEWKNNRSFANNMGVMHGYWDKSLRKWVRIHDIYSFRENKDAKLKKEGVSTTHITLNQFLQKNKAVRRNAAELCSSSSSAILSSNVRDNFVAKKKRKKKRFPQKSECQKLDAFKMEKSKVRKFASQLNAKKKTMRSNESSSVSTLNNSKPNSLLKRANGNEAYEKEDNTKNIRLMEMKNKPKINSVKLLTTARLKKEKQNWRIVKNVV